MKKLKQSRELDATDMPKKEKRALHRNNGVGHLLWRKDRQTYRRLLAEAKDLGYC